MKYENEPTDDAARQLILDQFMDNCVGHPDQTKGCLNHLFLALGDKALPALLILCKVNAILSEFKVSGV